MTLSAVQAVAAVNGGADIECFSVVFVVVVVVIVVYIRFDFVP